MGSSGSDQIRDYFSYIDGWINYSAFSSLARFQGSILFPFGIYCLDFVRGIALLGIFLINSVLFAWGFMRSVFCVKDLARELQ
jgi:hypothetical protein